MNGAITKILNDALGDWIENLDSNNMNLSLSSGSLLLQNLIIRKSAFNNLGLPFKLLHGFLGKISASIPWKTIGSSPIKVLIEDLHIFLSPIEADQWDEQYEISRYFLQKLATIKQIEALKTAEVDNKSKGFVEKLVSKIVDNIQIEVRSVYFQYFDSISSRRNFSFGITLGCLKAVTCNKNWVEEFVEGSSVMYKLIQLENFKIFLDYVEVSLNEPSQGC